MIIGALASAAIQKLIASVAWSETARVRGRLVWFPDPSMRITEVCTMRLKHLIDSVQTEMYASIRTQGESWLATKD